MKVLERYKNGNASVTIWSDGTREIEFLMEKKST